LRSPPGVSGSDVVAAAASAPVGANVSPFRVSALRSRWPRNRWSGKLPRASQCCQWWAVQTSRRYASSNVYGGSCSVHDSAQNLVCPSLSSVRAVARPPSNPIRRSVVSRSSMSTPSARAVPWW
jgi:hypothetical protein